MDNDREEDEYDNHDYEEGYYKNDVAGDDEEMRTDHKEDETIYSKEEHEVRLNRPLTYDNNRKWLLKIRTGKHKGEFKKKKRTVCLLICWCMVVLVEIYDTKLLNNRLITFHFRNLINHFQETICFRSTDN